MIRDSDGHMGIICCANAEEFADQLRQFRFPQETHDTYALQQYFLIFREENPRAFNANNFRTEAAMVVYNNEFADEAEMFIKRVARENGWIPDGDTHG